jgi:hypothetical protein
MVSEKTPAGADMRLQLEHRKPQAICRRSRRRVGAARHDHCPGAEISKVALELDRAIRRVQRGASRRRADCQEGHGKVRPV